MLIFLILITISRQLSSVGNLWRELQELQMSSPVMSLVLWYDSKPFYFRIFSISALMLTYYDAWN